MLHHYQVQHRTSKEQTYQQFPDKQLVHLLPTGAPGSTWSGQTSGLFSATSASGSTVSGQSTSYGTTSTLGSTVSGQTYPPLGTNSVSSFTTTKQL